MMKFKILLLIMLVFAVFTSNLKLISQESDERLEIFDDSFWDTDFKTSFKMEHPVIELVYGINQSSIHKDFFSSEFAQTASITGRFGFTDIKTNLFSSNVFEYDFAGLELAYTSSDLNFNKQDVEEKIGINVWKLGFASIEGFGHQFTDKTNLLFTTASNLSWNGIDYEKKLNNSDDQKLMERFADGVRVSESMESSIKIQIYEPLAITAAYTREMILPRVLFWKWAGSGILFGFGELVVSHFSEKIIKASPTFGPFFNFVLINAYKYGTYELRKKRMNWPFLSETPIMNEGFNVGLTFTF